MSTKYYYKDGTIFEGSYWDTDSSKILHRDDGPAVEHSDGSKEWCLEGLLHRDDGPAVEIVNSRYKEWYLHGKLHREDGPAIEHKRHKEWWIDGKKYTKKQFKKLLKEVDSLNPALGLLDLREWVRNRWKKRFNNEG